MPGKERGRLPEKRERKFSIEKFLKSKRQVSVSNVCCGFHSMGNQNIGRLAGVGGIIIPGKGSLSNYFRSL